jgi:hypothetical protein
MPRRYGSTKDITAVPEIDPLTYEEWEAALLTKGDVYQDFESQVRLISQKKNRYGGGQQMNRERGSPRGQNNDFNPNRSHFTMKAFGV